MYEELEKIYYRTGYMFPIAVSHVFDIGFRTAFSMTDEDIAECEGNGLMTAEFVQELQRTARELARVCNGDPCKLVMYCQNKKLFECTKKAIG